MVASVDKAQRMVFITGAIDSNDYSIVMKVPLPEAGEWTMVKAEVNLTDQPWIAWQMTLGEGMIIPLRDDEPELLSCRNFEQASYLPEPNVVCFHGGGEIRPGETVLKMAKFVTQVPEITLSHNRQLEAEAHELPYLLNEGKVLGGHLPIIEVVTPVQTMNAPKLLMNPSDLPEPAAG